MIEALLLTFLKLTSDPKQLAENFIASYVRSLYCTVISEAARRSVELKLEDLPDEQALANDHMQKSLRH